MTLTTVSTTVLYCDMFVYNVTYSLPTFVWFLFIYLYFIYFYQLLNICNPATQVMFVVASDNQQTSFPDLTVQVSEWDVKPYYTIPYHTIPYHTIPFLTVQVNEWGVEPILYHTILFLTFLTVQVSEKIVLAETEMIKKKWTAPNCSFRALVHVVVFASRWRKVVKAADNGNAYDMILPMRSSSPLPIPQRQLYTFFTARCYA